MPRRFRRLLLSHVMIMSYNDMIMTFEKQIINRVRHRRLQLGLTQAELAERAGISRSAVTAIEGHQLMTSVSAALSLAAALGTTVEDLFGDSSSEKEAPQWAWEPPSNKSRYWQAEVGGRMLRYPATTSPMLAQLPDNVGGAVDFGHSTVADETLVIACCDPAATLLASHFQQATGLRLIVLHRSSREAIRMLQKGLVHLAGLHFSTREQPAKNEELIRQELGAGYRSIRLARWEEGIVSSTRIGSVRAARSARLQWVGREPGSGARQCLDQVLENRPAPRRTARDHRGVVEAIRCGWADAGVCVRLAGEDAGLNFVPVQEEAYDVCYSASFADDRRFKAFQNVVRSTAYRKLIGQLPGYDTGETGHIWAEG